MDDTRHTFRVETRDHLLATILELLDALEGLPFRPITLRSIHDGTWRVSCGPALRDAVSQAIDYTEQPLEAKPRESHDLLLGIVRDAVSQAREGAMLTAAELSVALMVGAVCSACDEPATRRAGGVRYCDICGPITSDGERS